MREPSSWPPARVGWGSEPRVLTPLPRLRRCVPKTQILCAGIALESSRGSQTGPGSQWGPRLGQWDPLGSKWSPLGTQFEPIRLQFDPNWKTLGSKFGSNIYTNSRSTAPADVMLYYVISIFLSIMMKGVGSCFPRVLF